MVNVKKNKKNISSAKKINNYNTMDFTNHIPKIDYKNLYSPELKKIDENNLKRLGLKSVKMRSLGNFGINENNNNLNNV